jgi:hypothetical protein
MLKNEINDNLKKIHREIIKSAKKGDLFYYWDITGLPRILVDEVISNLEKEGKNVKSKGNNFKLIMW